MEITVTDKTSIFTFFTCFTHYIIFQWARG